MDKKEYTLNEQEIEILKQADQAGHRGMIWYKDFAISIPHISSIFLKDRRISSDHALAGPRDFSVPDALSPTELSERIAKVKERFIKR